MQIRALNSGLVLLILMSGTLFGSPIGGAWTSVESSTLAFGEVDGIRIVATTNEDAPFTEIATHSFTDDSIICGAWQADELALDPSVTSLTTTYVNAGDYQQFDFDVPWYNGYFYIENFDASSLAKITVLGGATASLATASTSISYDAAGSMGVLRSSNTSFDGEGDAVLLFDGPVTSIRVDYEDGVQANGVFYGFASMNAAIPEPVSLVVWALLIGLVVVGRRQFAG